MREIMRFPLALIFLIAISCGGDDGPSDPDSLGTAPRIAPIEPEATP
jgi:hypothetical protein